MKSEFAKSKLAQIAASSEEDERAERLREQFLSLEHLSEVARQAGPEIATAERGASQEMNTLVRDLNRYDIEGIKIARREQEDRQKIESVTVVRRDELKDLRKIQEDKEANQTEVKARATIIGRELGMKGEVTPEMVDEQLHDLFDDYLEDVAMKEVNEAEQLDTLLKLEEAKKAELKRLAKAREEEEAEANIADEFFREEERLRNEREGIPETVDEYMNELFENEDFMVDVEEAQIQEEKKRLTREKEEEEARFIDEYHAQEEDLRLAEELNEKERGLSALKSSAERERDPALRNVMLAAFTNIEPAEFNTMVNNLDADQVEKLRDFIVNAHSTAAVGNWGVGSSFSPKRLSSILSAKREEEDSRETTPGGVKSDLQKLKLIGPSTRGGTRLSTGLAQGINEAIEKGETAFRLHRQQGFPDVLLTSEVALANASNIAMQRAREELGRLGRTGLGQTIGERNEELHAYVSKRIRAGWRRRNRG
jgi:hypothetical protein